MRAFIFSLDAFVAFTLALIAIYSLIFFSSVPSAYFYMLTQAHYLARDTLMALSTTACSDLSMGCYNLDGSVLDNIAFHRDVTREDSDEREALIKETIGHMVPSQFGYTVSLSGDNGQTWDTLYDTASDTPSTRDDSHAKSSRKLSVSTQVMAFGYSDTVLKPEESHYYYGNGVCGAGAGAGEAGAGEGAEGGAAGPARVITCGEFPYDKGDGTTIWKPYGNVNPEGIGGAGGDLVPSSDAKIVKLTIFI